jgi:hypothetical protein
MPRALPIEYPDANRRLNTTSLSASPNASKLKLDFSYDHQGRRIQKLVSTNSGSGYVAQSTNRFVYDGWNLVAILNPQSAVLQSFCWGLDLSGTLQGAGGVGGLLAVNDTANGVHFCAYDGNGNVTALVNATDGTGSASYEYGPFGEVLRASGPMARANPFRFSTKYQDDESDQLYYGYPLPSQMNGVFQDSPSGWTGPVQFIVCRVCLEPCCFLQRVRTGGYVSLGGLKIVSVGPCVYWKKGDKGDLSSDGFTRVDGPNQNWQVGMDTDFPLAAKGGCFKCAK